MRCGLDIAWGWYNRRRYMPPCAGEDSQPSGVTLPSWIITWSLQRADLANTQRADSELKTLTPIERAGLCRPLEHEVNTLRP